MNLRSSSISSKRPNFDEVLKELFEVDRPGLLDVLKGGAGIRSFLNVELPKVLARRVDLAMWLEDDSVFHLEFQAGMRS